MGNIAKRTVNTPDSYKLDASGRSVSLDKIYLGVVKSVDDLQHMGRLKVWIAELGGNPNDSSTWFIVNYCSPFAGATNYFTNKTGPSYLDTQTSYGMWFVPPDIENQVIVAFINGDSAKGVWLGCLYQQYMNHMVPGIPGNNSSATVPVAEYNKKLAFNDITKPKRPTYSPLSDQLDKQGLNNDPVRGVTTSGARRDDPSNDVYGILTPGGNQFVFDDNTQNKFIRLRTQSGAQLLINDSTGCIYLNSVDGKNWISMDATGKIDVYAVDDITIRSQGSVNIRGDLDVNIEAGRDINMRAKGTPPVTPVVNTSTPPLPPPQSIGPITVIGDSIAVGVGGRIESSLTFANVGDNSSQILDKVQSNTNLANAVNTILSVGSNDGNQTLLASNLNKIRTALGKSNFIWLLPYASETNATVKTFASSKGDKYIDLTKYPSNDKIHPKDYSVVANDARALCVEAPPSATSAAETAAGFTQSGLKAEGSSWYNPGYYKTLAEAQEGAQKYKSMADYARANPQNYKPEEQLAIFKFEAAAQAEVRRLGGGSSSTTSSGTSTGSTYTFGARTIESFNFDTGLVMAATVTQTSNTSATGSTTTTSTPDFNTVASEFIKTEEGFKTNAYIDPPKDPTSYSIGYGHCMGQNEMRTGRTFLNCGSAGQVPIKGQYGKDTVVTKEQAEGLFIVDLRAFVLQCRQALGGAWDKLNVYQQVAVADFCYNCGVGNVYKLNAGNKFTDYIAQNQIKSAADLIRNFQTPYSLPKRRAKEAAYFEGHPELAPVGPSETTPDGYPNSTTSGEASLSPISTLKGGYIRMQSKNDMHLLSDNNMFITSKQDQNRVTGKNLYETIFGGTSRYTGGSVLESVVGGFGLGVQGRININGARIDLNGDSPPAATPASPAVGPRGQKQTDSILNSIGNATPILTDTILPHLPYHEPYQNHGGRNFQNIRNSTNTDKKTQLRDCEVIRDSDMPLDVYGTPRPDMPPGVYIGVQYSVKNTPIWNYNGPAMTSLFQKAAGLQLSDNGRTFITSRENGSYRPLTIGNPTYTEIGYGHTLTPEEISQGYVLIKGLEVRLNTPFTQQQINDLFDQDMAKVLTWMRPLIKVGVTQTQFDMLASLAWNIGESNFSKSDVVKYLNNGTLQKVPNNWMIFTVDANGQTVPGLVTRRIAEATNFMLAPSTDVPQGQLSVIPS